MSLLVCNSINEMPPNRKEVSETQNDLFHPQVDFHHTPLVDRDYQIHESLSEFEWFDIYCWMEDQFLNQTK